MTKPKSNPKTETPAAPAVHTPNRGKFVTVASKIPMSITIQLCKPTEKAVSGQHGPTTEKFHTPYGAIYVIRGTGYPEGNKLPKGFPKRPEMIEDQNGGYALTPGVPADFWNDWLKQNAETEMVLNGMIKAQHDLESLAADAAEHADRDSGLGPLNPEMDAKGNPLDRRAPKPASLSVAAVTPEPRPTA